MKKYLILKKKKKNKKFKISYFGRICHDKGLHILVEALSKVKIDFTFNIDVDHIEDNSYFENLITKIKKDSFSKNKIYQM